MKKNLSISMFLFLHSTMCFSQGFSLPLEQWLSSLKPMMVQGFCDHELSPFKKIYKGDNCLADVERLFDQCTTSVENVKLPPVITQASANQNGSIIGECIAAYYQGGEALKAFNFVQEMAQ